MTRLSIHLFGQLRLHRDGRALDRFPSCKERDLFCYLVLHRQRLHSRNLLAGLLWGDKPEEQARKLLRTSLWRLRNLLEPEGTPHGVHLVIHNGDIGFNTTGDYWLDVEEFETGLAGLGSLGAPETHAGQADPEVVLGSVTRAVEHYEGELLVGCYEDWCLYERERLHNLFLRALMRLMIYHQRRGAHEVAIQYGQRILSHDLLLEEVHREMMRLHCLAGNRGAALRQYQVCRSALEREFGVEPMEETIALYEEIRTNHSISVSRAEDREERPPLPSAAPPLPAPGARDPHPSLAVQLDAALRELREVQAGMQQLTDHRFQHSLAALENIREVLDRAKPPEK